jgi:hypothetical protein
MLVNWQLSDAGGKSFPIHSVGSTNGLTIAGILLGFVCNIIIFSIPAVKHISWRLQTVTVLIPIISLLLILYLVPGEEISSTTPTYMMTLTCIESPRFLMKHGKYREALGAFTLLRPGPAGPLMAARDMYYAHAQLEVESRLIARRRAPGQQDDAHYDLPKRLEAIPRER